MTLEEIKAKEFCEGLERGREEGVTNMLRGMLVSFKEELLLESAYQLISCNPECRSMSFEEIRDIWDSLS